jgi:hypothetical protein
VNPPKPGEIRNNLTGFKAQQKKTTGGVKKSLISGKEGYETIQMDTQVEIRSVSFALSQLEKIAEGEVIDMMKDVRFLKSQYGIVFDLPSQEAQDLLSSFSDASNTVSFKLSAVSDMPEVTEPPSQSLARLPPKPREGRSDDREGRDDRRGGGNREPTQRDSNNEEWGAGNTDWG